MMMLMTIMMAMTLKLRHPVNTTKLSICSSEVVKLWRFVTILHITTARKLGSHSFMIAKWFT